MKWKDYKPAPADFRQLGKTTMQQAYLVAWLDWIKRGSPPDEDIPELFAFEKVKV